MPTARHLVVSADDYGLADSVSDTIRALIADGRLSATGCMCVFPDWPRHARALDGFDRWADLGLHLTLTDHTPLTKCPRLAPGGRFPPLTQLVRACLTGQLPQNEVQGEIQAQIDAFAQARGHLPHFIDGHHHVHGFPGVARALLTVAGADLAAGRLWIRDCWEQTNRIIRRRVALPRALMIRGLTTPLHQAIVRQALPANQGFTGVHGFRPETDYGGLFRRFLIGADSGTLIGCHPGRVDASLRARDSLTTAREQEAAYFASSQYLQDLATAGVRLARPRACWGPAEGAPTAEQRGEKGEAPPAAPGQRAKAPPS
ncbi:ChbG/HpnK family deacetylase [Pararhodospirillum photometricum]|uniref:YdjC-like protein n=1 Tax=Pararhodospirillum photometricum DSM 122 TaxID=1150469 RepID=H6SKF2_PARPM|nr:ChbG/HpnK family deacetylase [Pararhodospirillum photometricum]CCG08467.1 Putative uncharacterized protein [Pararhodospirillum photometricum DSM 122]